MDIEAAQLTADIKCLRHAHSKILTQMPQTHVVAALAEFAERWLDPDFPPRGEAELIDDPFPFAMVKVSLDALLDSLSADRLWALIDSEGMRGRRGYPLIGHVIAGNTPLLAWVSIIRALLVGSASLVKLPSGPAAAWGRLFLQSLAVVSPELAACVSLKMWRGGETNLDLLLCQGVDLVMAQGSNMTLRVLKSLCPAGTRFVGYGHRVSFGLVTSGSVTVDTAAGFARDTLLYDQGGCLSPQTIFVEGGGQEVIDFAELLADALAQAAIELPLPHRAAKAAMIVREARQLAQMEEGNRLWQDPALRWTVIARSQQVFAHSPTFGVVSVQPFEKINALDKALAPVVGSLQGCALASREIHCISGVSRVCQPGHLQAPPLNWRQDSKDVLRILTG